MATKPMPFPPFKKGQAPGKKPMTPSKGKRGC